MHDAQELRTIHQHHPVRVVIKWNIDRSKRSQKTPQSWVLLQVPIGTCDRAPEPRPSPFGTCTARLDTQDRSSWRDGDEAQLGGSRRRCAERGVEELMRDAVALSS